MGSILFK